MVCCEVYFFEARQNAYPADHAWWFRDAKGQKVSFWRGAYNMDVGDAEYIEHIARRILAVHDAVEGKAGIFLDNLRFEVVKYERNAVDNAESKVYLSKKLLPDLIQGHRSARTVVQVAL